MDRSTLTMYLDQGLSTRAIARLTGKSQTTVRYWIRKYQPTTNAEVRRKQHRCATCGESEPSNFYGRMKGMCRRCFNDQTLQRMRHTIARIRQQMGGRCAVCGFDKYAVALDLHHVDSSEKDPDFRRWRFWSRERVEREAAKCVLLCRNCHAGVHAGLESVPAVLLGNMGVNTG